MAERYGEIPKMFTKKWWQYYWDYYKIHTLVVTFALAMIIALIYQFATKVNYDMYMTYVSDISPNENYTLTLHDKLFDTLPDIDNNGEKNLYLNQHVFNDEYKDEEFTSAIITRFQYEFISEDSMLFIFSDEKSPYLFKNVDLSSDAFLPVSEWLSEDLDIDKNMLLYSNGEAYGVSLSKSAVNPDTDKNFYVALRKPVSYDSGEVSDSFKTAVEIANKMIFLQ